MRAVLEAIALGAGCGLAQAADGVIRNDAFLYFSGSQHVLIDGASQAGIDARKEAARRPEPYGSEVQNEEVPLPLFEDQAGIDRGLAVLGIAPGEPARLGNVTIERAVQPAEPAAVPAPAPAPAEAKIIAEPSPELRELQAVIVEPPAAIPDHPLTSSTPPLPAPPPQAARRPAQPEPGTCGYLGEDTIVACLDESGEIDGRDKLAILGFGLSPNVATVANKQVGDALTRFLNRIRGPGRLNTRIVSTDDANCIGDCALRITLTRSE